MDIDALIADVEPRAYARASLLGWLAYLMDGLASAERTSNTERIGHYHRLIQDLREHLEGRANDKH